MHPTTTEALSSQYPYWRTESLSPDARPLINGQAGRMFLGMSPLDERVHAHAEIEILGLTPAQVHQAEAFFTKEWHAWTVMPVWLRSAVESALRAETRTAVVAASS